MENECKVFVNKSVLEVLLMNEIILKYAEEKNITDTNELEKPEHKSVIQERYNGIMSIYKNE